MEALMSRMHLSLALGMMIVVGSLAGSTYAQAVGACCISGGGVVQCHMLTEQQCHNEGGVWHPDATCEGSPCNAVPTGACCIQTPNGVICLTLTEDHCHNEGGVFHGAGTQCSNELCAPPPPPLGACCLSGVGTVCAMLTHEQCVAEGGEFFPDATCENPPCDLSAVGACCIV